MLDENDIELTDRGICMDCLDERASHMNDKCKECGSEVGEHALYIGTIGMRMCEGCDFDMCMKQDN